MTPTALQRIKEIEKEFNIQGSDLTDTDCALLLKAFNVMRAIAVAIAHEEFHKIPDWIDEEFENRMSK